jgi:hypothetical protein
MVLWLKKASCDAPRSCRVLMLANHRTTSFQSAAATRWQIQLPDHVMVKDRYLKRSLQNGARALSLAPATPPDLRDDNWS